MLQPFGHKERQMAFSGKLFYMDNKTTKAEERTSVEICKSRVRQAHIEHRGKTPQRVKESRSRRLKITLCRAFFLSIDALQKRQASRGTY